jgi:peptide/nickel transport system substrate-binding protein
MSLAINRQAISTVGESGTEPTATNVVGIIPAFSNYLLPQYAHPDLSVQDDKAIALLKAAGYTQGSDGVMANSKGTKLAYSCEDPGPYEDYTTDCALIKADLQKIGIAVTVKAVSVNQWAADLTSGNFQLSVHWDSPNGPSPYFQMLAWLDSTYGAPIGKTATWDFERWNDPATQTLISQFENATSDSERQTAIQGLEKIMAEQVPVIPLVFGAYFAEANESQVAGWPGPANPYAPLSPYDPVDEVVALNLVPR